MPDNVEYLTINNPTLTLTIMQHHTDYHQIPWPMCHLSIKFCEIRQNSFSVILLTNKLTKADENITS